MLQRTEKKSIPYLPLELRNKSSTLKGNYEAKVNIHLPTSNNPVRQTISVKSSNWIDFLIMLI